MLNLAGLTAVPPAGGRAVTVGPAALSLSLPIVSEPVNPVPEASYAVLRREVVDDVTTVECVRFAYAPEAARIELIDPNDLHGQIVRRRTVFHWRDTPRINRESTYAIQKVTTGGSTHFPPL